MTSRSLLVIDPDRASHALLLELLQREDRTIQSAYDVPQAEACLRATPYDVVVAGQGSNGPDGLHLVQRVHALQPAARVILTGDRDPARVIRAIRARAFGYCHNPPRAATLNDIVQQALDTQAWRNDIAVVSASPAWITLDVRCKMEAGDRAAHFLREMVADLPAQIHEDVTAAFRELLLNGIEHGGKYDPHKHVRVSVQRTARALIVQILDPGQGFSLNTLPHAAISNPEDSPIHHVEVRAETGQRPGGFGLLMARNLVDELIYNERGNGVMFVKYLK